MGSLVDTGIPESYLSHSDVSGFWLVIVYLIILTVILLYDEYSPISKWARKNPFYVNLLYILGPIIILFIS